MIIEVEGVFFEIQKEEEVFNSWTTKQTRVKLMQDNGLYINLTAEDHKRGRYLSRFMEYFEVGDRVRVWIELKSNFNKTNLDLVKILKIEK